MSPHLIYNEKKPPNQKFAEPATFSDPEGVVGYFSPCHEPTAIAPTTTNASTHRIIGISEGLATRIAIARALKTTISPTRSAMRILLVIRRVQSLFRPYCEQLLSVLNRLAIVHQHLDNFTGDIRLDLVHQFHGFNDA